MVANRSFRSKEPNQVFLHEAKLKIMTSPANPLYDIDIVSQRRSSAGVLMLSQS